MRSKSRALAASVSAHVSHSSASAAVDGHSSSAPSSSLSLVLNSQCQLQNRRHQNHTQQQCCASVAIVEEEQEPATLLMRNRMDVRVVDISKALTDLCVEWKPESPLQPPGAPTETICSSLVEGRGELVLFGGVTREMNSPMVTNVAVNKLYFLHP